MIQHQPTTIDEIAVAPVSNHLYWFNGLPTSEENLFAIGLHLPCGNPAIDPLADVLGWTSYTVLHSDKPKPYWQVNGSLIFIASNVHKFREERKGIVYGWGPLWDYRSGDWKHNKQGALANICQVKVRLLIREFVSLGFCEPFELSLRGRITDSFLQTCKATYRLTGALVSKRRHNESPDLVYLYSVSVPIQASSQSIPVGEGTFIYPIVAALPPRLSAEFVQEHETPAEVVRLIQANLLPEAIRWSTEESARIKAGARPDGGRAASSDSPVLPVNPGAQEATIVVTEAEEEKVLDLLFADASVSTGEEMAASQQQRQRLEHLKAAFAHYVPLFSQGTPDWWKALLAHRFPARWSEASQVVETDLSEDDLEQLALLLTQIRQRFPPLASTLAEN